MEKTAYSYARIGKIAYPIFLTLLVQNLIQVIDTAFLGHVGEVELGASAIAGIYYIAVFTIAFGFSTGAQILIGRRNGEKNFNKIGEIVCCGIVFLWLVALCIFAFTRLFSEPILVKMLHSKNVLIASLDYLNWRIWGLFFATVNVMFRAFFVGITRTKVLTLNAIVMALTNIFFDYALIFGQWGFPEMGIGGAALASVISEAVSTIFFLIYTFCAVDLKKYGFTGIVPNNFKVIRNMLNVSFSLMIQQFLSLTTWLYFFFVIERMGETTLAISNIIRSFYMIIGIPVFALSATASTLVSNTIGAGKQAEVIALIWKIVRITFTISMFFALLLFFFPQWILQIYTTDAALIKESIPSLYVILLVLLVLSVGNVFFQSVSGTGNTRSALAIEITTLVLYVCWMWFVAIYLKASLAVCWTTEFIYAFFIGLLSYVYFKRGKWQGKKI
ncbi:MAG: MATE family efflux transporter [Candidatus Symbiothrix sp.]|jgi:putative MATE family efflux protein|nr:MATE family efflux transporter [Candidatus Symbiothrix sp.]